MENDNKNQKQMKEYMEKLSAKASEERRKILLSAANFEAKRLERLKEMTSSLKGKLGKEGKDHPAFIRFSQGKLGKGGKDHPLLIRLNEEVKATKALRASFLKEAKQKPKPKDR